MTTITFQNAGVIAVNPLFTDLSFSVSKGDRVGLIAGNGGGKTTLLNCIAGTSALSSGTIIRSRGLRLGFVEQGISDNLTTLTLREAVQHALPTDARENESWRADVALDSFEAPEAMRDRMLSELSGGWQRLMLIARTWVNDPDALLMDEPTNHLDLGKILQLEDWMLNAAGNIPVIIASHDREFLDATTNRTLFLRSSKSQYFALPYSKAKQALTEQDSAAARQQEKELKDADRLRKQAAKLKNIGVNSGSDLLTTKSKQLKERAAKIENAAKSLHVEVSGEVRLSNRGTHAKVLLGVEALYVCTPSNKTLYKIDKLHIFQGDRIVLLGRNGSGKSQLIKALNLAITTATYAQNIKVTPSLALGYLDQDLSTLDAKLSPLEVIGDFSLGDVRVRAMLATAGFPIERQSQPVGTLSYGQRTRLALLALRLSQPNFYLMDEPTNHMDIPAQEQLEVEILHHQATCVLVSHDRRFVRNIGTRYLQIIKKKLVEVEGPESFFEELMLEQLG